jgi:hypothetical protein
MRSREIDLVLSGLAHLQYDPIDVISIYSLAIPCFSVLYVYAVRRDNGAVSEVLKLSNAIYFSIVTMTTTSMEMYLRSRDERDSGERPNLVLVLL